MGKRFGALLAVLLLGGCASVELPPHQTETYPPPVFAPHFILRGRLSIRVEQKIDNATLRWQRSSGLERLQFFTPLGSQVAEIEQLENAPAILRQGEARSAREAPSIALLTSEMLGVALDTGKVVRWTQGIELTEGTATMVNMGDGQLWSVMADQFRHEGNHRVVSRLTAIRGDTVIKLVIDEWEALD